MHGTSARYSYSKVKRDLPKWKSFINKFVPIFPEETWEYLCGTRRVVLFENEKAKEGFHGPEQFRFDVLDKLKPHLKKNMTVYGELVGWANGSTIMPKHDITKLKDKAFLEKYGEQIVYKYGTREGESRFVVYRISIITEDGFSLDFTPLQIAEWCERNGFEYIRQVYPTFIYDGDSKALRVLVEELTEREGLLAEDYIDPSHISEGVVVRVDANTPTPGLYKNKSFPFKLMEGIAKEKEIDMEDAS